MLGMSLRAILPKDHLGDNSMNVVKMGMGLVATMAALVLSLVISSAKNSFDAVNTEMTGAASQVIQLDRTLALYGPETKGARESLRGMVAGVVSRMESKTAIDLSRLQASTRDVEGVFDQIQGLAPKDDRQRTIQAEAIVLSNSLQQTRWLMYEQQSASISLPMLIVLITWLSTLFVSFGLFAPANATVVVSLLVSALSVSGAIFLILELYAPFDGMIRVSSAPLHAALLQLGN